MMEEDGKVLATVPGDGGEGARGRKAVEAALASAKAEVKHIADHRREAQAWSGKEAVDENEDTLFCRWAGQHADGLKHDTDERPAEPFDGALDSRVRYADMVLSEKVKLAVLALLKARIRVAGVESGDNAYAARLGTVARWLKENQWGVDYLVEMAKWVRFAFGDQPAASLMEVHYRREQVLELQKISMGELGLLYVELALAGMDEEAAEEMAPQLAEDFEALRALMLHDASALDEAAGVLRAYFPHLAESRARKVVRAARRQAAEGLEDPVFEFPRPVVREEGPVLVARRVYRDFFLPQNTARFKDARCYFIREWLTETELRKRVVSMDYSQEFVDRVLERGDDGGGFEHGGKSVFDQDWKDARRGLFEILTQYRLAVNEENIPGVYVLAFHYDVETPALPEFLLDYPHGGYPGVLLAREVLSDRVLDSRGIGEIAGPMQGVVKGFIDAAGNNANLNTLPAFQTFGRRSSSRLKLGMLEENKINRGGEIKAIQVGQYPASALKGAREMVRMYNEYFGRQDEDVPEAVWQAEMEWLVAWVLRHAAGVWKMALQYMQEYMPGELMERIAGAKLGEAPLTREEIRGAFDIRLEFDGRDFDFEFIKAKAELFKNLLLPLDTRATGRWEEALKSLFEAVDPNLAERVVVPAPEAERGEMEDEHANIVKISSGIEVFPVEAGQDFRVRLQVLQEWAQANAEEIAGWPQRKRELLEARAKHLQFMVQQLENARTGRTGV